MRDRDPLNPEARRLPAAEADRLLERASQIDATREVSVPVAQLRAVATEAGISPEAFDAALSELPASAPEGFSAAVERPRTTRRWRAWAVAAAALVALGSIGVSRTVAPAASPPMVNEAVLVRCLPLAEAADLVRPYLDLPANAVMVRKGSRVLNVRGTQEQLQQVKAVLDRYELAGSACPARPGAL